MVEEKSDLLDTTSSVDLNNNTSTESFKVPEVVSSSGISTKKSNETVQTPKTPNLAAVAATMTTPPLSDTSKKRNHSSTAASADTSMMSKLLTSMQHHMTVNRGGQVVPSQVSQFNVETPSKSTSLSGTGAHLYMTPSSSVSRQTPGPTKFEMVTPVRRPNTAGTNSSSGGSGGYAFISHSPTTFPTLQPEIDDAQLARRKRRRTSPTELQILEEEFARCMKPSKTLREDIARRVEMTEKAVQIWFQNRRQAVRRQEQLFSSSSNDGGSSDTGGLSLTPATSNTNRRGGHTSSSGNKNAHHRNSNATPAQKFPSEGVIQYRINGYQHRPPSSASATSSLSASGPFTEGILLNNHKLASLGLFDSQYDSLRTNSMPTNNKNNTSLNDAKFTIFSDGDTDEEPESNATADSEKNFYRSRYTAARPTLSSVRTVSSPVEPPIHKRQLVAPGTMNRVTDGLSKSSSLSVACLKLQMASDGKAQVVIERSRNGCAVSPLPLKPRGSKAAENKRVSPSTVKEEEVEVEEEEEIEPPAAVSEAKRAASLLRTKLARSIVKAQLIGNHDRSSHALLRSSPTKRRSLRATTNSTPPGSPSKRRKQRMLGKRSPLSPRKVVPQQHAAMSIEGLSPSKIRKKSPSRSNQFSAAAFPALPKSRSFMSALLMRNQPASAQATAKSSAKANEAYSHTSSRQNSVSSKSPRGSPGKGSMATSRDLPSSPPFRLPAWQSRCEPSSATSSSSSSSSSSSGSPPSRKHRSQALTVESYRMSKHKFARAFANAAASASSKNMGILKKSNNMTATNKKKNSLELCSPETRRRASTHYSGGGSSSSSTSENEDMMQDEETNKIKKKDKLVRTKRASIHSPGGNSSRKTGRHHHKEQVETREVECINNLLSLRAGDWA